MSVWILALLVIMLISSVVLYVEPSFPLAVLGVYSIEVIMYANLFLDHERFQEVTSRSKKREYVEIFQLEKDE